MEITKILYTTIFIMLFEVPINAQRYPFQWVNVPDSISKELDVMYGDEKVGAGKNVYKLNVYDDFEFNNGIYSYKGMGSHFLPKFFLYYDGHIYYFKADAECIYEFLKEWNFYINSIHIKDKDIIDFSVDILKYFYPNNGTDNIVFIDAVPNYINIILDSCSNKVMKTAIFSKLSEYITDSNNKRKYEKINASAELLYGEWYFQTEIHIKKTMAGKSVSQKTCGDMPRLIFCQQGKGMIYNNSLIKSNRQGDSLLSFPNETNGRMKTDELNNTFRWFYNKNRFTMRNIDKSIFKKKDISLHLKDMFVHNDKIFMELEYKNIIYVMSKKIK